MLKIQPSLELSHLCDIAPYILGTQTFVSGKEFQQVSTDTFQEFYDKLQQYETAQYILSQVESYTDFYNFCPDFAVWFPKSEQQELFYAAKNGSMVLGVPSKLVYLLKRALAEYPAPNLAIKYLPIRTLTSYFSQGAFAEGISLYAIICNLIHSSYTVFDKNHRKNQCNGFTEIYIKYEDMVALVSDEIAIQLDDDFIKTIKLTRDGLMGEGGVLISKLGGREGIVNSFYDLRKVV